MKRKNPVKVLNPELVVDFKFLRKSIPYIIDTFNRLIEQGFFDRFKDQKKLNILEFDSKTAPIVWALPELEEALAKRDIFVKIKYLGIEYSRAMVQELKRHFFEKDSICFRSIDVRRPDLVQNAMTQCGIDAADLVFFRCPVVIGLSWSKWGPHSLLVLNVIDSVLRIINEGYQFISIKTLLNFMVCIVISHYYTATDIATGFEFFQEIFKGNITQLYQNATVLITNFNWWEQQIVKDILSGPLPPFRNVTQIVMEDFSSFDPELQRFLSVVSNYDYREPSRELWPSLDEVVNSQLMGMMTFYYAVRNVIQGDYPAIAISKAWAIMQVQMLLPSGFHTLSFYFPAVLPVLKYLLSGPSALIIFGVILYNLPIVGALTCESVNLKALPGPKLIEEFKCASMIGLFSFGIDKLLSYFSRSQIVKNSVETVSQICQQGFGLFSQSRISQRFYGDSTAAFTKQLRP